MALILMFIAAQKNFPVLEIEISTAKISQIPPCRRIGNIL